MIVKNEDQWVWFALHSIMPYVDMILVTDTGSSDKTQEIVRALASPKIHFRQTNVQTPSEITAERMRQLRATQTDWIWIVDGDEIYPRETVKECLAAIKTNVYEGIVVRRYDLLGDIYHRQRESVGSYQMLGQTGHFVTRFVNQAKITGLHYAGDYPREGWYDKAGKSIHERDGSTWYITQEYLYHAMYLKRSSLGGNLPMFNRGKYKIETGMTIKRSIPSVFSLARPANVPDPLKRRAKTYEAIATIVTPLKNLKRRLTS